jgi:hypothetical protein
MQRVAHPSPFPFLDLLLNEDLPSSLPEVLVRNHLWQSDVEEAFVDDSLVSDNFSKINTCERVHVNNAQHFDTVYKLHMAKIFRKHVNKSAVLKPSYSNNIYINYHDYH